MRYFIKIFIIIIFLGEFFLLNDPAKATESALTGYVWSENAGWINLNPAGGGVILQDTGDFKGYAWGENVGWLSFNCLNTASCATSNFKASVDLVPLYPPSTGCGACPVCAVCSASSDAEPPVLSSIAASAIASKAATIKWNTNEPADSIIEYGIDASYKFLTGNAGDISNPAISHSVDLKSLSSDITYHYRIISRDARGNISKSQDLIFKTLPSSEPNKTDNPDNLQLILPEEAIIKNLTDSSASVSWQTDAAANSLVRLKLADDSNNKWQETGDTGNYAINHLVALAGLKSDALYQYQVKSSNSFGSTAVSKIKTFRTKPSPVISAVAVSDITLDSAVVSWETNIASTTAINYGPSAEYGISASAGGNALGTAHEIKLKNLKSGATYNFKVKGSDDSDNLIVSDNYVFTTFEMPLILNYDVQSVGDNSVSLKWISNMYTDSIITYTNVKTSESRTQGDTKFVKEHLLKLTDVEPGTDYVLKIGGADILGNKAVGPEIKIKTPEDKFPPVIAAVRTYTTIIQNKDKGQAVIVWRTDEAATSQVFLYSMSNKELPLYTSVFDANPTTNHTVVISELALGSTFRFNIESKDKSGNSALSNDFSVQTPSVRKSIIQLILEAFEKIFGWTKNLKI